MMLKCRPHNFSSQFRLFLLFAATLALFSCGGADGRRPPEARGGVLDLSGWDLEKDGPLELNGEWKFAWAESKPEFSRPDFNDAGWLNFRVPAAWDDVTGSADGYAWFRLTVRRAGPEAARLGLFIKQMQTAGRMFINGQEVMRDGTPGTSRETTIACSIPQAAPLPAGTGGDFVIAWEISNFHNWKGGPRFSPVIGAYRDLSFSFWLQDLRDLFLSGFILMMGLYSFILWLMRSSDRASLFFAGICLALALRILFLDGFFQRLLPNADIYDLRSRLESIVTLLAVTLCVNFFARLFPLEFHKLIVRVSNWLALALGVFFLALPCWITSRFTLGCDVFMGFFFLWILLSTVRAAKNKREGAPVVTVSLALLGLTLANDIFGNSLPSLHAYDLFGVGAVGLIVCYSGILSYRFARAHRLSETLSANLRAEVDRQTERITAQNRELERLVKEKTDSFVNFNHEIKTPLTLMGNYLERAMRSHSDDRDLGIVRQNLDKLMRDVTNSLDLEKLIRNQVFYRHDQIVPLAHAVREKAELFRPLAEKKNIALRLSIAAERARIRIDPFALDRILNNLLDNAIRYTAPGGTVSVALGAERGGNGKRIAFVVSDTGTGIPAAQLPHIFEPYYQVRHRKCNLAGMGMGLCIVKKIVDELGGEIAVSSGEQQGSRFSLFFKACRETAAAEAAPALPAPSRPLAPADYRLMSETFAAGKDSLLVVEDNTAMLAYLQAGLAEEYNVFYARSGREAVLKLETIPEPQLIVSDIMMDEMDGYEFLDALIRSEKFRGIPLVFLTARTAAEDRLTGLAKGAVDVIPKPFSFDELKSKIASLIRNRKTGREAVIREVQKTMNSLLLGGGKVKGNGYVLEEKYQRFKITRREREIIPFLLQGLGYKEIANRLSISPNTLKPYVRGIYKKCGIKNKVELIGLFKTN